MSLIYIILLLWISSEKSRSMQELGRKQFIVYY